MNIEEQEYLERHFKKVIAFILFLAIIASW